MSRKFDNDSNDIEIIDFDLEDIEDRAISELAASIDEHLGNNSPKKEIAEDESLPKIQPVEDIKEDNDDLPKIQPAEDINEKDDIILQIQPVEEIRTDSEELPVIQSAESVEDELMNKVPEKEKSDKSQIESKTKQEAVSEEKPKKKKSGVDVVRSFLMVIAVCVLVYAGYQLTMIFMEYKAASDEYQAAIEEYTSDETVTYSADYDLGDPFDPNFTPTQVDWQGLVSLNSEIYAWIEFESPDLGINYPIAKGVDNDYYLNHTVNGTENNSGSIFIDAAQDPFFHDPNTFIYGHNMKDGSMFGNLKHYKKAEYYAGHEYFWIYTPDSRSRYKIFACYEPEATSNTYNWWSDYCEEYTQYLADSKAASWYDTGVTVNPDDKIITLSTCTSRDTYRFIVQAKLIYREFK